MRVSNVHYRGYNSPEQQFLFPPAAGGETFFIVFVLKSFFIQPVRVGLFSTPTASNSSSKFYAGFPPVGVNSACICVLTVSENVIKMSGEIFRKCLYPKQKIPLTIDCVLNLG